MTAVAIAKAFQPNEVMTLGELYAALAGFKIYLVCINGEWVARGWVSPGWVGATGATPMAAVAGLLERIGGGS